jgi:hypothetical protein
MKNFFKTGSIAFIVILTILGMICLYGAVTIAGAWHLWVIFLMEVALDASFIRDLKRENSKN